MSRLDLLLLLMVAIWGANFSLIKIALRDFPEIPFNALRLSVASAVFLVALRATAGRSLVRLSAPDWRRLFVLGLVGHLLYQLLFLAGVARTSVANSSLIFGCTPVVVAILSWAAGHERLTPARWAGAALSFAGIYAIVGHKADLSAETFAGDALVFGGMVCWSLYSVLAQPLLEHHSPLVVTGCSITIGTVMYLAVAILPMLETNWAAISGGSWVLMVASALFALAFAYMVWYTAVQRIGSARTSVYSNLTPIAAMAIAVVWLGEHIDAVEMLGAALILGGIAVTRYQSSAA